MRGFHLVCRDNREARTFCSLLNMVGQNSLCLLRRNECLTSGPFLCIFKFAQTPEIGGLGTSGSLENDCTVSYM